MRTPNPSHVHPIPPAVNDANYEQVSASKALAARMRGIAYFLKSLLLEAYPPYDKELLKPRKWWTLETMLAEQKSSPNPKNIESSK